jgi:hypothetical protein
VFGELTVRRVAGRLHFAVHQQSFIDVLPQVRAQQAFQLPQQHIVMCYKIPAAVAECTSIAVWLPTAC